MNSKSFLHFVRRHLSLIRLVALAAGLWMVDTYTDWWVLPQRMLHRMSILPFGWVLAAVGLVIAGLLLVLWRNRHAKQVVRQWAPIIGVVTASGEALRILLTEKKYPSESYWSGHATDARGEMHQLVICQPGNATTVVGQQVTMSLRIASAREAIAAQFNELVGARALRSQ